MSNDKNKKIDDKDIAKLSEISELLQKLFEAEDKLLSKIQKS